MIRAELLLWSGVVAVVAGIACYDWRAALIAGGVFMAGLGYLLAIGGGNAGEHNP
jgi:hypothetical protein